MRIENSELKSRPNTGTGSVSGTTTTPPVTTTPTTPTTPQQPSVPKTEAEKKRDIIVSNIVSSLPDILKRNNITASGSIGLFEFIEPKNFFISIDDGMNPAGVTAFKTKILFEYDSNLNLKVIGIFDLEYTTQRYITRKGTNPFAGVTRIRMKNPSYAGKLLEEIAPVVTPPAGNNTTTTPSKPPVTSGTSTGTTANPSVVTFDDVQKSYDKNKLGDTITLATTYLATDPKNAEVLTMRARSYYIFSRYDEMLGDISAIYQVQGANMNCGIINDGARAEKALKGAKGNTFTDLQGSKCKK